MIIHNVPLFILSQMALLLLGISIGYCWLNRKEGEERMTKKDQSLEKALIGITIPGYQNGPDAYTKDVLIKSAVPAINYAAIIINGNIILSFEEAYALIGREKSE